MAIDKTNPVGRFGCFKVLPLIYDEALSYYEVICKLRDSLNDVITQANSLVDALGMTDSEITELEQIVGEGSVDDRIYGAELSAKAYTDEQLAKSGAVLFTGSMEHGNTHQPCVNGDFKISDYKAVVVYGDRPYGDGGVVCAVTPFVEEGSGVYSISGIGNIGLEMDDTTGAYLLRVFLRYDSATNELTRSQSTKPDSSGNTVYDTITKIIGVM